MINSISEQLKSEPESETGVKSELQLETELIEKFELFDNTFNGKHIKQIINKGRIDEVEDAYEFVVGLRDYINSGTSRRRFKVVERKMLQLWELELFARVLKLRRDKNRKAEMRRLRRVSRSSSVNKSKTSEVDTENKTLAKVTRVLLNEIVKTEAKAKTKTKQNRYTRYTQVQNSALSQEQQKLIEDLKKKEALGKSPQVALAEISSEAMLPSGTDKDGDELFNKLIEQQERGI